MKSLVLLFFLLFSSTQLYADITITNNFNGNSSDGWSNDAGVDGWLLINSGATASKTYNFGATYANAKIYISYGTYAQYWEASDTLSMTIDGATVDTNSYPGADGSNTWRWLGINDFEATADATGSITLGLRVNSNKSNERAYIDSVTLVAVTPPGAYDDTADVFINDYGVIDVCDNDVNVDESTIAITSGPSNGVASVFAPGKIIYTPAADFNGTDTLTYSVGDANGSIYTATVTITVKPFATVYDTGFHDFDIVNPLAQNLVGDYRVAGNTVMCLINRTNGYGTQSDVCLDGTSHQSKTSNGYVSRYIDIDGNGSTWNSTSSYITIPSSYDPTRGIAWAGLFWQGRISASNDHPLHFHEELSGGGFNTTETGNGSGGYTVNVANTKANYIKLKINTGTYQDVQAKSLYTYSSNGGVTYAAFAEVTDLLQDASLGIGKHTFTVANLLTEEGREDTPGVFGGWSLVVIYLEDLYLGQARNISIYNGFIKLPIPSGLNDTVTISGFKLPKAGDVTSRLSMFSGEGEYLYGSDTGEHDWMKLSDDGSTFSNIPGATYSDNMFDGVLDGVTRDNIVDNNLSLNNDGVDIDTYDVSTLMTGYRDTDPNIDTAYIKFSSNNDYVTPSMLAFSAELYVPKMCYDYTYRQDGLTYTEENNGTETADIVIPNNSGNRIDVKILVRSLDGDVDFSHVTLYSDMNLSKVQYKPGYFSMTDTGVGSSHYTSWSEITSTTCNETFNTSSLLCQTTTGNFRIGLGNGALGYPLENAGGFTSGEEVRFKYSLDPQNSDPLDTPLNLFVDIQYKLAGGGGTDLAPVYGVPLGDPRRMSLCPPDASYNPEWGIMNVIDTNLNKYRTGQTGSEYFNNLLTQVSSRNFFIDVVSLNAAQTPPTNPLDINTSVSVEVFDASEMHDHNNTCTDYDVSLVLSDIKHLNFNDTNRSMQRMLTSRAVDEAALRIWYIRKDRNASANIVTDWNATTDSNGNLLGIVNLYEQIPDAPTYCASQCTPSTTTTCYQCLKENFGYALCSRDNFSVRPESFFIKIHDSNLLGTDLEVRTNTDTNVTVKLAAEYNYLMDINATNHLDNNSTAGYRRTFQENSTDALLLLRWTGLSTGCNDINNTSYNFEVTNGATTNVGLSKTNVGYYTLDMNDTNWTFVDQGTPLHHTTANNFIVNTQDCRSNSSIVDDDNVTLANQARNVGCVISSSHTVDTRYSGRNPLVTPNVYQDFNISFHPYRLSVDQLIMSHGPDLDTDFNATANGEEVFIYLSERDDEDNMSLNAIGSISAVGFGGTVLSNYVGTCYAEDLNLTLQTALPGCDDNFFGYHLQNFDENGSDVAKNIRLSGLSIELDDNNFTKELNGTMNIQINYNYDKNATNLTMNPKRLNIAGLLVDCNVSANCIISANQNNNYSYSQTAPINNAVNFVQGRTHAPRYRIDGNQSNIILYQEIYWDGNAICNPNTVILPNNQMLSVDSINWYRNTRHQATDGSATLSENRPTIYVTELNQTLPLNGHSLHGLRYNDATLGYPYRSTMNINTDNWLIYHRFDANATVNSLDIEFNQEGSGIDESKMVDDNAEVNSNRRIMW